MKSNLLCETRYSIHFRLRIRHVASVGPTSTHAFHSSTRAGTLVRDFRLTASNGGLKQAHFLFRGCCRRVCSQAWQGLHARVELSAAGVLSRFAELVQPACNNTPARPWLRRASRSGKNTYVSNIDVARWSADSARNARVFGYFHYTPLHRNVADVTPPRRVC